MSLKNIEFKAKIPAIEEYEHKLLTLQPRFVGEDHQKDTYFNVKQGRLKLREGNIENALIHYQREDAAQARLSQIILYKHQPDEALTQILTRTLGVRVVVEKVRRIYFVDNVKFHFDRVAGLGTFLEVEALDLQGQHPVEKLEQQCRHYMAFFGLQPGQIEEKSYSDMLG